jgi:hypothetical protein
MADYIPLHANDWLALELINSAIGKQQNSHPEEVFIVEVKPRVSPPQISSEVEMPNRTNWKASDNVFINVAMNKKTNPHQMYPLTRLKKCFKKQKKKKSW